ncbi:LytR/AlgR family response regulator transcription factor [Mongoliitalea daihaiensis]|uniref:LytR/AlgR family response regulator transcription factor n=1 Tax=Mongoliitalea daihaiensis TaxID=2782006 RepID=UPI001F24B007|nr:response regulator [Mongoliitalea daihaiensis]UJP66012.1 response regulator [Mongoliitalea daihaiensis]
MLNVLIVDDEFHAQENTEIFIQKYFSGLLKVIGKCSDVKDALVAIHNQEPDLVLLDIQMPNQSGLDLLDIVEPRNFDVIFLTAHEEHVLQAIKKDAFDYLLKPLDAQEFQKTIFRYLSKQSSEKKKTKKSEVLNISAFSTIYGLEFIKHDEISYCEAQKNYTIIYKTNGEYITLTKTLGAIEELLPNEQFVRVHQSYLVNMKEIQRFIRSESKIVMRSGKEISVSIRRKTLLFNFE